MISFKLKDIKSRTDILYAIGKAVAVCLSYFAGMLLNSIVHEDKSYIGAMLACVASVVVLQTEDVKGSMKLGWVRVFGTFVGAVIAVFYLSFFSFSLLHMGVAVLILEIFCMVMGIPNDGKMATITLIIIFISSDFNPSLSPFENGLLRFSESATGAAIGIFIVWLLSLLKQIKLKAKK